MSNYTTFDPSVTQRFWSKVEAGPFMDCWFWTAAKIRKGYGRFYIDGKGEMAHRVSWVLHFGSIPDDLYCLHRCDNPSCVNPYHLFLGTHQENMNDMVHKGRSKSGNVQGEINGRSKLSAVQVLGIRNMYAKGDISTYQLGKRFGISQAGIFAIVKRITWSHI